MLCVIGCGNSTRSDDGVGVYVAQTLRAQLQRNPQPDVLVFDAGTGGMDVMFQARGTSRLIIVDASNSGSEAGAIFRVPGRELESEPDVGFSLHDFRWQHALTAGRKIFGDNFPSDVTVFLIEAASLRFGLELSAPVLLSADRVVEEIRGTILGWKNRADSPHASSGVSVGRGNFYLSREICDTYLPGVVSVALLARDDEVLIVPLTQQSAGGLLLKHRNSRGDRVIHAQEFFRARNLPEDFELRAMRVQWSRESAALIVSGLTAFHSAPQCVQISTAPPTNPRPPETCRLSDIPEHQNPGSLQRR
jgi:hydrogenase maturation protease